VDISKINELVNKLAAAGEIKAIDIPDIDLYMDQVTTFIDSRLGCEKRDKKDKLLTKTMINNYSKAKILTPSKSKRYNRQQMMQLILIYYLKQILSISDIHDLFKPLLSSNSDNQNPIAEIYDLFLQIKKNSVKNVSEMLVEMDELIGQASTAKPMDEKTEMLLTVLMLTAQAQACKRAAEAIIDSYFKEND
jgi:hypothetical protein